MLHSSKNCYSYSTVPGIYGGKQTESKGIGLFTNNLVNLSKKAKNAKATICTVYCNTLYINDRLSRFSVIRNGLGPGGSG